MSLWVYPISQELSFMYRGLFLLGSTLFNVGLYLIGEMYTLFLTSKHQFSIEKKKFFYLLILGLRTNKTGREKKKY
jgi:hypothetical protein